MRDKQIDAMLADQVGSKGTGKFDRCSRLSYDSFVITTMTVTELVRDTCQEAAARTARGEEILVKSGGRPLFKIVPNRADEELPALSSLESDLQALASGADRNPVMKLRARRL